MNMPLICFNVSHITAPHSLWCWEQRKCQIFIFVPYQIYLCSNIRPSDSAPRLSLPGSHSWWSHESASLCSRPSSSMTLLSSVCQRCGTKMPPSWFDLFLWLDHRSSFLLCFRLRLWSSNHSTLIWRCDLHCGVLLSPLFFFPSSLLPFLPPFLSCQDSGSLLGVSDHSALILNSSKPSSVLTETTDCWHFTINNTPAVKHERLKWTLSENHSDLKFHFQKWSSSKTVMLRTISMDMFDQRVPETS